MNAKYSLNVHWNKWQVKSKYFMFRASIIAAGYRGDGGTALQSSYISS